MTHRTQESTVHIMKDKNHNQPSEATHRESLGGSQTNHLCPQEVSPSQLTHVYLHSGGSPQLQVAVFIGFSLYRPDGLNHWPQGPAHSLALTLSLEVRLISCGPKPGSFKLHGWSFWCVQLPTQVISLP